MRREVPKTFGEVMKLQRELDSKINNIRPRTLIDILMSMNAELMEFNEASKGSHKTWKSKTFNQQDFEEEGADVLFFAAQLANWMEDIAGYKGISTWSKVFGDGFDSETVRVSKEFRSIMKTSKEENDLAAVYTVMTEVCRITELKKEEWESGRLFEYLATMYALVDYSKETLFQRYLEKWEKNFKRIGTEWNGPEKSEEE